MPVVRIHLAGEFQSSHYLPLLLGLAFHHNGHLKTIKTLHQGHVLYLWLILVHKSVLHQKFQVNAFIVLYSLLQLKVSCLQSLYFLPELLILACQFIPLLCDRCAFKIHHFTFFLFHFLFLHRHNWGSRFLTNVQGIPSFLLDAHNFELQIIPIDLHFFCIFALQIVKKISHCLTFFFD